MRAQLYDRLRVLSPSWFRRWMKNRSWFTPFSKLVFGNDVYSRSYYDDVERIEATSVVHVAKWIQGRLGPDRAIDVGCGPGHLMAQLEQLGVQTFGVDLSEAALAKVAAKGLSAEQFDLSVPHRSLPGTPYDLAISCEVAEHLEAAFARTFVEKLTTAAANIYLTAAEPETDIGPGLYHVNEQPNHYWIDLMKERGFELDQSATDDARQRLATPEVVSYLQRPMIFRKRC